MATAVEKRVSQTSLGSVIASIQEKIEIYNPTSGNMVVSTNCPEVCYGTKQLPAGVEYICWLGTPEGPKGEGATGLLSEKRSAAGSVSIVVQTLILSGEVYRGGAAECPPGALEFSKPFVVDPELRRILIHRCCPLLELVNFFPLGLFSSSSRFFEGNGA